MKKIHLQILLSVFYGIFCFLIIGCNGKKEKNKLNKQIEYEFERKMVTYDFGNGSTEKVELYIDKLNDTIGNQIFAYNNEIIDKSKSLFYELNIEKIKNSNEYIGKIKYHFNPNKEGKLVGFTFTVISKTEEKTDFINFENYDKIKNQLEFKFKNSSDTIIGHIHSQHTMDIKNNEEKLRFREIFISVDNYEKTNNPFTKGLR
ncbi:hypothetical protein BXQ17_08035 [Polaribacter sp. BM10]|uniref:hypothetical protein n=1 Tax=Polaribacter sp. BM10 TaxID=1529069 RepID=UPI00098AF249|nr:hypothetical protein [Polaribacter sp. BM10]AQS94015.1 hypothetical protein BXQ17_08035 [Polaribacter sp. BM10]